MNPNRIIPEKPLTLSCEDLVIGSGAGGSLTAAYLKRQGKDVLMVEEGPFITNAHKDFRATNSFPSMWREGGFVPILGKSKFAFGEGRVLGGSTMVNAGLFHRVSPEVFAEWHRDYGFDSFSYEEYISYAERLEKEIGAASLPEEGDAATFFREGAEKMHFHSVTVPVTVSEEKGKYVKNNMLRTYLKEACDKGARLLTDCSVKKIIFSGKIAVSVLATYTTEKGERLPLRIHFKNLHICAGATHTALLLKRSGITHRVGGVRFHPTLRVTALFDHPIHAEESLMSTLQIKEFGPTVSMGASISLAPFVAPGLSFNWDANKHLLDKVPNMATYYVMIRSHHEGKVHTLPFGGSFTSYSLDRVDLEAMSKGYAFLTDVLFAAGAKELYPAITGTSSVTHPTDTARFKEGALLSPNTLNLFSVHSFGSCPLGTNEASTACDIYGKVRGKENVYVNDASLLPNSPGVNPQGPLMAFVLRNLEHNFS